MVFEDQHVLGAVCVGGDAINNVIHVGCIT